MTYYNSKEALEYAFNLAPKMEIVAIPTDDERYKNATCVPHLYKKEFIIKNYTNTVITVSDQFVEEIVYIKPLGRPIVQAPGFVEILIHTNIKGSKSSSLRGDTRTVLCRIKESEFRDKPVYIEKLDIVISHGEHISADNLYHPTLVNRLGKSGSDDFLSKFSAAPFIISLSTSMPNIPFCYMYFNGQITKHTVLFNPNEETGCYIMRVMSSEQDMYNFRLSELEVNPHIEFHNMHIFLDYDLDRLKQYLFHNGIVFDPTTILDKDMIYDRSSEDPMPITIINDSDKPNKKSEKKEILKPSVPKSEFEELLDRRVSGILAEKDRELASLKLHYEDIITGLENKITRLVNDKEKIQNEKDQILVDNKKTFKSYRSKIDELELINDKLTTALKAELKMKEMENEKLKSEVNREKIEAAKENEKLKTEREKINNKNTKVSFWTTVIKTVAVVVPVVLALVKIFSKSTSFI